MDEMKEIIAEQTIMIRRQMKKIAEQTHLITHLQESLDKYQEKSGKEK